MKEALLLDEAEKVKEEEIARLATRAEPRGTVWSKYNLAEALPEPTPMSWAIARRLFSGNGALGSMYRDLGYRPDPRVNEEGIYDLICGRPFCNLSREPLFYASGLPLRHSFETLKADPGRALSPSAELASEELDWRFLLAFPLRFFRSIRAQRRQSVWQRKLPDHLRRVFPAWAKLVRREAETVRSLRDVGQLLQILEAWIGKTIRDFAADSLKAGLFTGLLERRIREKLHSRLRSDESSAVIGKLLLGIRPDPEADLGKALSDLQAGSLDRSKFLDRFGHHCHTEMELSQPRWIEDRAALDHVLTSGFGPLTPSPDVSKLCEEAAGHAGMAHADRDRLELQVRALRDFVSLRETARHYLMMGYGLIRQILMELDCRFRLEGGIFFLVPDELGRLAAGEDFSALIGHRRSRRALTLSLPVPPVLFSDDLDAIGRPIPVVDATIMNGVPLSPGVAEGTALVLREPRSSELPPKPFILVCPSTDPAWVPLFAHASALLMETGGILSHGAIVAREFGLPAVAGLDGLMQRVKTGERLRVNGTTGAINLMDASSGRSNTLGAHSG
jgi:pyruvate,water dikinase